jgi:hypothetical protein
VGSGSAPIGTPVACQVHELDQRVGPHVARRSHFGAYSHIWGKDDRTLRMKKYAPHLLKALNLEGYEVVSGKHFLQEDFSRAIASLIARLISASGSAA